MVELHKGMRGGRKQMWLREHRALVLEYLNAYGPEETIKHFNMKRSTLDSLVNRVEPWNPTPFAKAEKALQQIEILREQVYDTNARQRYMEVQFGQFAETVSDQISRKFLAPLLRHTIKLPKSLEIEQKPDPLELSGLPKEKTNNANSKPKA